MTQETDNGLEPKPELVEIKINGTDYRVRRGPHKVEGLKELGHVPLADDLLENIDGKLKLLPDDGTVDIKGGEIFISHPKGSSSS